MVDPHSDTFTGPKQVDSGVVPAAFWEVAAAVTKVEIDTVTSVGSKVLKI